jgi:trehalose/maltose hydrolase-like predicted phosphorylase
MNDSGGGGELLGSSDDTLQPTADPAWVIAEDGYDHLRESNFASRFAISNGLMGIRGGNAINREPCWVVAPHTKVAGLFDTLDINGSIPALVPAADWQKVKVRLPNRPRAQLANHVLSQCVTLDLRRGALLVTSQLQGANAARARLRTLRLVSLKQRSVGLQLIQVEIEAGEMEVTHEASFEGLELGLAIERQEQDLAVWRTQHSGKRLAIAAASFLQIDGRECPPTEGNPFTWSWTWTTRAGQVVSFQRIVAVSRSDSDALDPGIKARDELDAALSFGWRRVVAEHEAAWAQRWRCSDVEVGGDPAAQQALRFAIYHLNSAANPTDERVSIAARALTGDDYLGHVFWDTEIYLLPFYTMTWPEAARAMLMYRFHTLDAARSKAAQMGWRGAMYAWESADTGEETTPPQVVAPDRRVVPVLCGMQEQHITADVAFAVWQYWQATADEGFLLEAGAEILLEVGRFWSSRAQTESDGVSHIRGVIGPDEYHETIDDNAFTNVMARWAIRRALDLAELVRSRWPEAWTSLASRLKLDEAELAQWRHTAETLATGLDAKTGLYEQFAGFFTLEQIDLTPYKDRPVPMDIVLGRDRIKRSQVVKQADVVALLGLLPEEFPGTLAAANFRYYEPRCSHGSSLSRPMHGLAAARLGDADMALDYFKATAATDLASTHVSISSGVHIAALGGLWQMAVFGFAGLSLHADTVALDPKLPISWDSLKFSIRWRCRSLTIRIDQEKRVVEAMLDDGEPMTLVIQGLPHEMVRDRPLRARFTGVSRSSP